MSVPAVTFATGRCSDFLVAAQHVRQIGPKPFGVLHPLADILDEPVDRFPVAILVVRLLPVVFPLVGTAVRVGGIVARRLVMTRWTIVVGKLDFSVGKLNRFVLQFPTGRILSRPFRWLPLAGGSFVVKDENIAVVFFNFASQISSVSNQLWFDQWH